MRQAFVALGATLAIILTGPAIGSTQATTTTTRHANLGPVVQRTVVNRHVVRPCTPYRARHHLCHPHRTVHRTTKTVVRTHG